MTDQLTKRGLTEEVFQNKSFLFTGYYGHYNTGDDTFCIVTCWGAKHYWKANNIRYWSRNIPIMPNNCRKSLISMQYIPGQYILELLPYFLKKPILIFGGGSIFQGKTGMQWPFIDFLKNFSGLQYGAIGVSLGPYENDNSREEVRKFLRHASFLVLRDNRSYREALSMGLSCKPIEGFDLAAFLPDIYGLPMTNIHDSTKLILGVSVCYYERYKKKNVEIETNRINKIMDTIHILTKREKIIIRLFEFSGSDDREITKIFYENISKIATVEYVPYSSNPKDMWIQLGECNAVLSTRLHAGIFSFFSEVPFVQVEYHQKCSDFLEDIGYPSEWRVGDMECSITDLVNLLMEMIIGKIRPMPFDQLKYKTKAKQNFFAVKSALCY